MNSEPRGGTLVENWPGQSDRIILLTIPRQLPILLSEAKAEPSRTLYYSDLILFVISLVGSVVAILTSLLFPRHTWHAPDPGPLH